MPEAAAPELLALRLELSSRLLRFLIDPVRLVTVVEAGERIVTIVGLSAQEVAEVLAEVRPAERSVGDRVRDLAEAIVTQLGYAPVG